MKTHKTNALDDLIIATELQRAHELALVKEQFHIIYDSVKPINVIKKAFNTITTSEEIQTDIVNSAIGVGTGILSKKLLMGNTQSPIKRLIGTLLEFAVANIVSKYTKDYTSIGSHMLKHFISDGSPKQKV